PAHAGRGRGRRRVHPPAGGGRGASRCRGAPDLGGRPWSPALARPAAGAPYPRGRGLSRPRRPGLRRGAGAAPAPSASAGAARGGGGMKTEVGFELLRTLVAIAVALALGYVIIYLVSEEPGYAFSTLVTGPLTSVRRFGNFIEMAIPLVFTGLALSLVFQASQFNIGAEGQLFLGAVAATMVGIAFQLPPVIHVTLALAAAAAAGALGGAVPGLLKARWGANELVSSLMLN